MTPPPMSCASCHRAITGPHLFSICNNFRPSCCSRSPSILGRLILLDERRHVQSADLLRRAVVDRNSGDNVSWERNRDVKRSQKESRREPRCLNVHVSALVNIGRLRPRPLEEEFNSMSPNRNSRHMKPSHETNADWEFSCDCHSSGIDADQDVLAATLDAYIVTKYYVTLHALEPPFVRLLTLAGS